MTLGTGRARITPLITGGMVARQHWASIIAVIACITGAMPHSWLNPQAALAVSRTLAPEPQLALTQTVLHAPTLGGQVTYAISVTNISPSGYGYDLSVTDLLPTGVHFVSASSTQLLSAMQSPLTPSSTTTNTNGDGSTQQSLSFAELTNLAPNQSVGIQVVGQLDTSVAPGAALANTVTASLNDDPRGTGTAVTASSTTTATVLDFTLSASVVQSSGVGQVSGTTSGLYTYDLIASNNAINTTTGAVLTDVLPDGVQYLSTTNGPTPQISFDAASGQTTLTYTLGDLTAGQQTPISIQAAIPYTYTDAEGGPIADGTILTDDALLTGSLNGISQQASATAAVTAKYATINKAASAATLTIGQVLTYTLTTAVSQYFDAANVLITDTLPDGQEYITGTATINGTPAAPGRVRLDRATGRITAMVWAVPANLTSASHSAIVKYAAKVDPQYLSGQSVVAGDILANTAQIGYVAHSLIHNNIVSGSDHASVRGIIALPTIAKTIASISGQGSVVGNQATGAVGDTVRYTLIFTGSTAADMNNITVADYLPPGLQLATNPHYTYAGTYTGTISGPTPLAAHGVAWTLGTGLPAVFPRGQWWAVSFDTVMTSNPSGSQLVNRVMYAGQNSTGQTYSGRADMPLTQIAPALVIRKTAGLLPGEQVFAGQPISYTLTVGNIGTSAAFGPVVSDTLPMGMRQTAPVLVYAAMYAGSTPVGLLTPRSATYDPQTGVQVWAFPNTAQTTLPAASSEVTRTMKLVYRATVDSDVASGTTLTNLAQASGVTQGANVSSGISQTVTSATTANTATVTSIMIDKLEQSSISPDGMAQPGEPLTYRLTFTVPPHTALYDGVMTDSLPADVSFGQSSGPAPLVPSPAVTGQVTPIVTTDGSGETTVVWGLGNVTNLGDSIGVYVITYTAQLRDHPAVVASATRTNSATVAWSTAPSTQPHTTVSVSTTNTISVTEPSVTMAEMGSLTNGATAVFTFGNTINTGNGTLYDTSINELLPAGLTYLSSSVAPSVVTPNLDGTTGLVFPIGPIGPGGTIPQIVVRTSLGLTVTGTLTDSVVLEGYSLAQNSTINGERRQYVSSASAAITVPFVPTETPTDTPADTATPTDTPSNTATATDKATATVTNTPADTATSTPVDTATTTPADTATQASTNTPADTATITPTNIAVDTATDAPTTIPTDTPTNVPSDTAIPTQTATSTPTDIPAQTATSTPTNNPTNTATQTPVDTATNTLVATITQTSTPVDTATNTPIPTHTATDTATDTQVPDNTATQTPQDTATQTTVPVNTITDTTTETPVPANTATGTAIPVDTATNTSQPLNTAVPPTDTSTATATPTDTSTATETASPTTTAINTPTAINTNTAINTPTATDTMTILPTDTATSTPSETPIPATSTPSETPIPVTATPQPSVTMTSQPTASATATELDAPVTATNTPTATDTSTAAPTAPLTPSAIGTATSTDTPANTPAATSEPVETKMPIATATDTPTDTATITATTQPQDSATATNTLLETATTTPTATATGTQSATNTTTATATLGIENSGKPLPTANTGSTATPIPTNTSIIPATATATNTELASNTPTTMATATKTATTTEINTATALPTQQPPTLLPRVIGVSATTTATPTSTEGIAGTALPTTEIVTTATATPDQPTPASTPTISPDDTATATPKAHAGTDKAMATPNANAGTNMVTATAKVARSSQVNPSSATPTVTPASTSTATEPATPVRTITATDTVTPVRTVTATDTSHHVQTDTALVTATTAPVQPTSTPSAIATTRPGLSSQTQPTVTPTTVSLNGAGASTPGAGQGAGPQLTASQGLHAAAGRSATALGTSHSAHPGAAHQQVLTHGHTTTHMYRHANAEHAATDPRIQGNTHVARPTGIRPHIQVSRPTATHQATRPRSLPRHPMSETPHHATRKIARTTSQYHSAGGAATMPQTPAQHSSQTQAGLPSVLPSRLPQTGQPHNLSGRSSSPIAALRNRQLPVEEPADPTGAWILPLLLLALSLILGGAWLRRLSDRTLDTTETAR